MEQIISLLIEYAPYIKGYVIIGIFYLLFITFIAGYNGTASGKEEFLAAVFWPVSMMGFLGLIIRLILQKVFG